MVKQQKELIQNIQQLILPKEQKKQKELINQIKSLAIPSINQLFPEIEDKIRKQVLYFKLYKNQKKLKANGFDFQIKQILIQIQKNCFFRDGNLKKMKDKIIGSPDFYSFIIILILLHGLFRANEYSKNNYPAAIKKIASRQHKVHRSKGNAIRIQKWRKIMLESIQSMKKKVIYDQNLLEDIQTIVKTIPQEKFIEATLSIEPFKPKFLLKKNKDMAERHLAKKNMTSKIGQNNIKTSLSNTDFDKFRGSISKFKQSIHQKINDSISDYKSNISNPLLKEVLKTVLEQETLTTEFQAKYHPFRKIIDSFTYIIENKYKMHVQRKIKKQQPTNMEEIQELLILDLNTLHQFILKSSSPYLKIFKSDNPEQKEHFQFKMIAFIKQYLQNHQRINYSIRKIMRNASRHTNLIKKLMLKVPDFVEVQFFQIPELYRIDGCFINAMNQLMQFAQSHNSEDSLKKLINFRAAIAKDVDDYYNQNSLVLNNREISTEIQLQILKFIIAKLKSFISEIYAQLKYLEVVYGEDDMSFKYDDSSYMYAQITVALGALQLQFNQ